MMLGVPALALAAVQHRGTFRRHKPSAKLTAGCSGAVSALLVFAVVTYVIEGLWYGHDLVRALPLFLTMLAMGMGLAIVCRTNVLWARRLPKPDSLPPSLKAWRFSLWELFGLVTAFALGIGVAVHAARSAKPRIGIYDSREECPYETPVNATKVSYRQDIRGTYYLEFDISETDFRQWVIERFKRHPKYKGIYSGIQPIAGMSYVYPVEFNGKSLPPAVTSGIECHWTFEDEGMHAVFDRSTGRA
jgi:hypothetical protein